MSDLTWEHHDEYGDTLVITSTDGDAEIHVTGPDGWASVEIPASALLRVALEAAGISPETLDQQVRDDIGVGHYGSAVEAMCALLWPGDERGDQ